MSSNIFENPEQPTFDGEVKSLRNSIRLIIKKNRILKDKIKTNSEIIRDNGLDNKNISLQALYEKKLDEAKLSKSVEALKTLEPHCMRFDRILPQIRSDSDSFTEVMVDIGELQELAQNTLNFFSAPFGFQNDFNEAELLPELERMLNKPGSTRNQIMIGATIGAICAAAVGATIYLTSKN